MSNFICEDNSKCMKMQSRVCLHCNRQVCSEHFIKHKDRVLNDLENEAKVILKGIEEKSLKRSNIFNDILISMNQWRTQQIEKVQQIYDDHLKLVQSHYDLLKNEEGKLFEIFEEKTLQPIKHEKTQISLNMKTINEIQQSIKNLHEDNIRLNWHITSSLCPIDIQPPVISIPSETSNSNIVPTNKSIPPKKTPVKNSCNDEKNRPIKRLVTMFSNISSIERSRNDILNYIKNIGNSFRLPTFVCSYLTAWDRTSKIDEKHIILNEYIKIIRTYLPKCKSNYDVLIGLQIFFHNSPVKQNSIKLMSFLLQFFLDRCCVNRQQILEWYKARDIPGYQGLYQAKQLAASFIKSLTEENLIVLDAEPKPVDHTNRERRDLLQ